MKSISDIISEAIEIYPNIQLVSDSTVVSTIKSIEDDLYQFVGKETKKDIQLLNDGTTHYLIATDFRCDNLIRVLLYDQNLGSSAVVGTPYTTIEDIDALKDTENVKYLHMEYSSAQYDMATVTYRATPPDISTDPGDWDSTYPVIEDEYYRLIVYKLIKLLSFSGDIPDISISNNFEREYKELYAKARADFNARKRRNKKNKIPFNTIW